MLDYVRWIFSLDFCTPRYVILRELGLKKLKIDWGLKAMSYEEKNREGERNRLVVECWEEKDKVECGLVKGKKDLFSKERERYYNRLGWDLEAIRILRREETDINRIVREREQDIQEQIIDSKIRNARYNKKIHGDRCKV